MNVHIFYLPPRRVAWPVTYCVNELAFRLGREMGYHHQRSLFESATRRLEGEYYVYSPFAYIYLPPQLNAPGARCDHVEYCKCIAFRKLIEITRLSIRSLTM